MTRPKVVNIKVKRTDNDVYIGRPSKWGNPFPITHSSTRKSVIDLYRLWIQKQPELMAALPELAGKNLVCFCAPLPCHGDVLADLVEALPSRAMITVWVRVYLNELDGETYVSQVRVFKSDPGIDWLNSRSQTIHECEVEDL